MSNPLPTKADSHPEFSAREYATNIVLRGVVEGAKLLPWRARLRTVGWITSRVIAPLAGWDKRVRDNLALIYPEMPEAEVRRMMRVVPANAGRTLIEIYSGAAFKSRAANAVITGAGWDALQEAMVKGQGVILVSGHFGNYDVPRAVLDARGFKVGGLYRPFGNRYFNAHYRRTIGEISQPIIPADDRKGLAEMIRFVRDGGMLGMLIDVHSSKYPVFRFFNRPARTATSAADMALKYGLLLVPVYGLRLDDDGHYELIVEAPIAHSTAGEMTQALNDSLERQVRAHSEQWFWIHRRWKTNGRPPAGMPEQTT